MPGKTRPKREQAPDSYTASIDVQAARDKQLADSEKRLNVKTAENERGVVFSSKWGWKGLEVTATMPKKDRQSP